MSTYSADFAADLRGVATLATRPERLDLTLAAALDALAEMVPYDLAVVLELVGQRLLVRCARGPLANAKVYGVKGAVSRLGLKPSTLQHRMRKHGIDKL